MAEISFTFHDGASTVLERWGERGPAIVCVHGMTSSRRAWVRLAQRLAPSHRVYAYDQRGHGDAASITGPMSLSQHVDDLAAVLAHVDGDVKALVGHSWGGAVVVLAGRATRARGIIAVDPMLRVVPGTFRADYVDDAEAMAAIPIANRPRWVDEHYAAWPALDVEGKKHAIARMTAEPIARLGADNRVDEGRWNILDAVTAYSTPLLVFAAKPDESVMSAQDVAHVKAAGGPHVRVSDFPDQGHNLHRTAFDRFAAQVEAFLASF